MHLPDFWLRDNCRCPKCRHPGNGQKLYEIVDLPADLSAIEAMVAPDSSVRVLWSDGHRSEYSAEWLNAHDLIPSARNTRRPQVALWGKAMEGNLPVGGLAADAAGSGQGTGPGSSATQRSGFGLLKNVPTQSGMVAEVGDRLGFVRVTNYGRLFDVISGAEPEQSGQYFARARACIPTTRIVTLRRACSCCIACNRMRRGETRCWSMASMPRKSCARRIRVPLRCSRPCR